MVLAPMSSVIKGAIQSLSPMVAFLLECVEPLVPRSFQRVFSGRLFRAQARCFYRTTGTCAEPLNAQVGA